MPCGRGWRGEGGGEGGGLEGEKDVEFARSLLDLLSERERGLPGKGRVIFCGTQMKTGTCRHKGKGNSFELIISYKPSLYLLFSAFSHENDHIEHKDFSNMSPLV